MSCAPFLVSFYHFQQLRTRSPVVAVTMSAFVISFCHVKLLLVKVHHFGFPILWNIFSRLGMPRKEVIIVSFSFVANVLMLHFELFYSQLNTKTNRL